MQQNKTESLLREIKHDLQKLLPVFERLAEEIKESRQERRELIRVSQGKGQVPLSVVLLLLSGMVVTLLLDRVKGSDLEFGGSGMGIQGNVKSRPLTSNKGAP